MALLRRAALQIFGFHAANGRERVRDCFVIWLREYGEKAVRHTTEAILAVALAATLWQLALVMKPFFTQADSVAPLPSTARPPVSAQTSLNVATLVNAHLFGQTAAVASAPVAANSDIKLSGIVYSPQATETVAIFTLNGKDTLGHVGVRLPNGETVAAIQTDRVILSRSGQSVTLLLDIKQANLNAHFTPAQFASASNVHSSDPGAIPLPDLPEDTVPTPPETTPTRRLPAATPHFESLQALRGAPAMRRFSRLQPPAALVPIARPHR